MLSRQKIILGKNVERKKKGKKNNFYKTEFRNLSGGIVAIHSGWKI